MAAMQLALQDLTIVRGGKTVILDLSFQVEPGTAVILKGANGVGKTTLLRAIAGFLPVQSGVVKLQTCLDRQVSSENNGEGEPIFDDVEENCHYIGHANGLRGTLTVRENLDFWSQFLQTGNNTTATRAISTDTPMLEISVANALQAFELTGLADMPTRYLSAGQKRRLGLARLLVAHRHVWLLDEPTVSLDTNSVDLLRRVIEAHLQAGGLVVAATHIPLGLTAARELLLSPVRHPTTDFNGVVQ